MQFRVMTLNLEQDHKRWPVRRPLILDEIGQRKPDLMALNEVCVPLQTGRDLCQAAAILTEADYKLGQQTRGNGLATVESEALLTRFDVLETGNLDYQARDMVALVARVMAGSVLLDVYSMHLYPFRGED